MRKLILAVLALSLVACDLNFDGLTALDNGAALLANQGIVARVTCGADSLAIATHETSSCVASNIVGTRLSFDAKAVSAWQSTDPASVSIAVDGMIEAETVPGTVWIIATGTYGSMDSTQVTAY